jgi:hypothetical protein
VRFVRLPCKLGSIEFNLSQALKHFFSLLPDINLMWLPLAMHKKIPTLVFYDLKLGFKFFLYKFLLNYTNTFFPCGQESYSIVASLINTSPAFCKFHCRCLYANSLRFYFCPCLQKSIFLTIFKQNQTQ